LPLTSGLKYVRSNNESADAYYYRGLCFEKMKHYTEALNDLNAAIKIAPKRPKYYEARSRTLKATGKTKLALSDVKQAGLLPRDLHVLFY
jgi:tetratricopeptide (TPR) repeat protein